MRNITYGGGRGQNISSLQPKTLYTLRARGRVGTHGEVLEVLVKGNNYKYTLTFNTTSFQEKVVTFLTPADITWMQINISKGPGSLGYLDEISLVK